MHFVRATGLAFSLTFIEVMLVSSLVGHFTFLWELTSILAFVNTIAINIFSLYIIRNRVLTIRMDDQNMDPTLRIANETLPYLRRGLNKDTARKTAEIILKISDVAAVAITDCEQILAYVGSGCERVLPGRQILTQATRQVIMTGELKIVENHESLNCPVKDCECHIGAAVIAPLKCQGTVVGCVKLYLTNEGKLPPHVIKLAVGIAQLLAVQMELSEIDRQSQLVTKAELQALHAQINPHFLFNTLNTIVMFSRTNPETARRLLIQLSAFFRHALKKHSMFNTLAEELEYVNTYLVLEKARFSDKLKILRDIDERLMDYKVPVLCIQPLVENAIKHGITPKMGQGAVQIIIQSAVDEMHIKIKDDGVGIPKDILPKVLSLGYGSGNGVGLSNVHERLKSMFGDEYGLKIVSEVDQGTTIYLRIPLLQEADLGGWENEVKSLNS